MKDNEVIAMNITFRNYVGAANCTGDYDKVREFFVTLADNCFTYARWDWMITHTHLDHSALGRIGLWEHGDELVGITLFDTEPGEAFCYTMPGYEHLKGEILTYAQGHLQRDGRLSVMIDDTDTALQSLAAKAGYVATESKDNTSCMVVCETDFTYRLPEGFMVTSLKDTYDVERYGRVLHNGFNHKLNGEGDFMLTPEKARAFENELVRRNVDLELKIAVVAPNGDFVSYCGMWYEHRLRTAVVEPLATDPDYRRKGLARAAVLEGVRRCAERGAVRALVGSSQQFYYSIGFRPYAAYTRWQKPE